MLDEQASTPAIPNAAPNAINKPAMTIPEIGAAAKGYDLLSNPYIYTPSPLANILWVPMVGIMTLFLTYQFVKYRAWNFWPLTLGLLLETIGLLLRAIDTKNPTLPTYSASTILLLSTPALLSLTLIQTYSRLIQYLHPTSSSRKILSLSLPPLKQLLTRALLILTFLSWIIQLTTTIILSQHFSKYIVSPNRPISIVVGLRKIQSVEKGLIAGVSIQIICIIALMGLAFYTLLTTRPTPQEKMVEKKLAEIETIHPDAGAEMESYRRQKAKSLYIPILIGSILLLLPTSYTLLTHPFSPALSRTSRISRNEWPFFILSALPMLLFSVLFALYHPGRLLPREVIGVWAKKVSSGEGRMGV